MKTQQKSIRVLLYPLLAIFFLLSAKGVQAKYFIGGTLNWQQQNMAIVPFAQPITESDQKDVLEKCMLLTELQQYLPKNADGSYKGLVVMQHAVSFVENNGAVHEGNTILYKTKGDIKGNNTDAYFYFNTFNIDQNSAKAEFTFYYDQNTATPKMAVVEVALAKSATVWAISNSKINIR